MTKLLGNVALTAIMASSLSAENLSDVDTNQAHTESTTPPPTEVLKSKESKSGFFLGVEGEVSENDYFRFFDGGGSGNLSWHILKGETSFSGNIALGYQHYFGANEFHGIKAQINIGSGMPIDAKSVLPTSIGNVTFNEDLYLLKSGVEISYLWDFFNRGKHTIGLEAGLGYELDTWFGDSKMDTGGLAKEKEQKHLSTLLAHKIYPKIGLHYYYGNHQFNIAYKFGGAISGIKGEVSRKNFWDDTAENIQSSITSDPSYFSFGYSYRF